MGEVCSFLAELRVASPVCNEFINDSLGRILGEERIVNSVCRHVASLHTLVELVSLTSGHRAVNLQLIDVRVVNMRVSAELVLVVVRRQVDVSEHANAEILDA